MVVRILTKYLLREFAWPLLYCFDAFAMLWIVMDLFGHLDDFIVNHASFATVLRYYITLFPEGFVQILPITLLLALLFCLTNLGRHNELTAMRVSGVSLARLALPLLGVGALATALVFVAGERLVPLSTATGTRACSTHAPARWIPLRSTSAIPTARPGSTYTPNARPGRTVAGDSMKLTSMTTAVVLDHRVVAPLKPISRRSRIPRDGWPSKARQPMR